MDWKCTGRFAGGALVLVAAVSGCGGDSGTPSESTATQMDGIATQQPPGVAGVGPTAPSADGMGASTNNGAVGTPPMVNMPGPVSDGPSSGTGGLNTGNGMAPTGTGGGMSPSGGTPPAGGMAPTGGSDMTAGGAPPADGGTPSAGDPPSPGDSPAGGEDMMAGAGAGAGSDGGCTPAPTGPFQTKVVRNTGPTRDYVIFQPATLGEGGFKHPPVAWGNGLATTPDLYIEFLENVASNGFVVIANPGTGSSPQVVRQGLEWLIEQNSGSSEYAGMLAQNCAGTIGYSMGGGAAIGSGSNPEVKAVVSIHGLPDQAGRVNGPLLLTTSEGDTFVTKGGFVMPNYTGSNRHPTMLASHTAQDNAPLFGDHLEPLGAGGLDAEPTIAWLRYWLYGDQSQREWFFGDNCKLCSWEEVRRKNHPEWN